MTEPTDLKGTYGYSRQAVEDYLRAVEAHRAELKASIADARARTARATQLIEKIIALELRIGEKIVEAHVPVGTAGGGQSVFSDGPLFDAGKVETVQHPPGSSREEPDSDSSQRWVPPAPTKGWGTDRG